MSHNFAREFEECCEIRDLIVSDGSERESRKTFLKMNFQDNYVNNDSQEVLFL